MKPQPMVVVDDVEASSKWFQSVLGCKSGHGGKEYEVLVDADRNAVLQLHHWDAHEHPHLGDPKLARGNGLLLWFSVQDFDAALARVRGVKATVLEGPKVNPNAKHREIWLKDPNGYTVVLSGRRGDL